VSLAVIHEVLQLGPDEASDRIAAHWAAVEVDHAARRDLAGLLVDRLKGKQNDMYDVMTREMPERMLLCLERHVEGTEGAWALGKEFIGLMRECPIPRVEGIAGSLFSIYHGDVSDDGDGPVEWCRPVPAEQAREAAEAFPALVVRTEPAHTEAFVALGRPTGEPLGSAQWQLISGAGREWAIAHRRGPSGLGVRITYTASPGATGPDCDFAVPLEPATPA
jgi:hypothetical protein